MAVKPSYTTYLSFFEVKELFDVPEEYFNFLATQVFFKYLLCNYIRQICNYESGLLGRCVIAVFDYRHRNIHNTR